MKLVARDYQLEDIDAVTTSFESAQRVLCRGATGLGKGVHIALLAKIFAERGRVLVLVDVDKLVRQLSRTIKQWTKIEPGIEMAESRAMNPGDGLNGDCDQIVVSSFQSQYSGAKDKERYRRFDPAQFSLVIVDETETVFPENRSRSVVDYYLNGNLNLKLAGFTATPYRTDGVAAANIFEAVAFDRDIIWGIDNGWLVPVKQAFVKVSVDFSTLKLRKNDDGDKDYSAEEIANLINHEKQLVELASGIIRVAENRKSIVVCPNVATAHAITDYLNREAAGISRCIYGKLDDEAKTEIFEAFERDEFQVLSSCSMLTKGFDSPRVSAVFNCRQTRSKRLYAQIMGRSTRTLPGLVDGLASADERRAAIEASDKPFALMVNMVGVEDWVRDITIIDILGNVEDPIVLERAKRIIAQEGKDTKEAIDQAQQELDFEQNDARIMAQAAQAVLDAQDEERNLRQSFDVNATVEVEYGEDLKSGEWFGRQPVAERDKNVISVKQRQFLRKFKFPDDVITKRGNRICPWIHGRLNKGLVVSYAQIQLLRHLGATNETIAKMKRSQVDDFVRSRKGRATR